MSDNTYEILVKFERYLHEDMCYIEERMQASGQTQEVAARSQLVAELQEACDDGNIAGNFEVLDVKFPPHTLSIDKMTKALQALVDTINATGGVEQAIEVTPAADPEWVDLGEAYLLACAALGVEPKVHVLPSGRTPEDPDCCDECGHCIPGGDGSIANKHHNETCSLFDSN